MSKTNFNTKKEKNTETNNVSMVWGNEFLDAGFTTLPNLITRYAPKMLTGREFTLIVVLSSFKHGSDYPFPSQNTLSAIMGTNERGIRRILQGLEEKEFLEVIFRYDKDGRTSNIYDFSPLLNLCLKEYQKEQREKDEKDGIKYAKKKKRREKNAKKENKVPVQNVPELPEQNVPELPEQNVPLPPVQNVPSNITREYNNQNITKEYQSIIETFKPSLKKTIEKNSDRLTDRDIYIIKKWLDIGILENINVTRLNAIIIDTLDHNKQGFEKYFESCLNNELRNTENKQAAQPKTGQNERIDTLPKHMLNKDKKTSESQNKEPGDIDADFEEQKRLLEAKLKKYSDKSNAV